MDDPRMHIKCYSAYHGCLIRSTWITDENYGDVVPGWTVFCRSSMLCYLSRSNTCSCLSDAPTAISLLCLGLDVAPLRYVQTIQELEMNCISIRQSWDCHVDRDSHLPDILVPDATYLLYVSSAL